MSQKQKDSPFWAVFFGSLSNVGVLQGHLLQIETFIH